MWKRTKRIPVSLRITSVLSKVEPGAGAVPSHLLRLQPKNPGSDRLRNTEFIATRFNYSFKKIGSPTFFAFQVVIYHLCRDLIHTEPIPRMQKFLNTVVRVTVSYFIFTVMSCETSFVFCSPTLLNGQNSGQSTELEEKARKSNTRVKTRLKGKKFEEKVENFT